MIGNRWFIPLLTLLLYSCVLCSCAFHFEDELTFVAVSPNPKGGIDQLYTLAGNFSAGEPSINKQSVPEALAINTLNPNDTRQLRLLHINDLHHHLADVGPEGPLYNAARISHQVKNARAHAGDNDIVLFVSAGDDTTGTDFDNLLGKTPQNFIQHAGYKVNSASGMDVAVLGNHEFDWGIDILKLAVEASAEFPVISSNIITDDKDWPVHKALIGVVKGIRFAFIGFTSPGDVPSGPLRQQGYWVLQPNNVLPKLIRILEPYTDAYIVINHLGYDGGAADAGANPQTDFFGDTKIAKMLSGLTNKPAMVVGGHTHSVLNIERLQPENLIDGIPVLQAGEFGQWLGQVTAFYTQTYSGLSADYTASLIPITAHPADGTPPAYDQSLQTSVVQPLIEANPVDSGRIGQVVATPELAWAQTAIDLYTGESAVANLITDAVVENSVSWPRGAMDLAAYNSTGIRGGFDRSGALTAADIHRILPYPDSIYVVTLNGRELKSIIQSNAQRIQHRQASISAEADFLHFSSRIRYTVILPTEDGRLPMATDIQIDGKPIDDLLDKQYRLALPRFLAIGRGNWSGDAVHINGIQVSNTPNLPAYVERSGYDTGLILRDEVQACLTNRRIISTQHGAAKDGRVRTIHATNHH